MRLSEATGLDDADADADLDDAMITIRDSKFGKSPRTPVHATVVAALYHFAVSDVQGFAYMLGRPR
jgi:preprotein translocase subunit SecD